MGSFFRVFGFMGQVLGMVRQNPMLLAPIALNLLIAVPVNIALAIALFFVPEQYASVVGNGLALVGLTALYFIDYFASGLTSSMVYDQVTTGKAELGSATMRTLKASPGILVFAAVSAALDLLSQLARERKGIMGVLGPILLGIVRTVWTTATYVVMPALVVEGRGFFDALARSKGLMNHDPTQVGVGVVGIGLVSFVLSLVTVFPAFAAFTFLASFGTLGAVAGILVFFSMVNLFWTLSGYLKSVYYTCFYLWAVECERHQSPSPQWAPAPLRNVLGDLQPAAAW